MSLHCALLDEMPARPAPGQTLSREQFADALKLHGFAGVATPFGIQFIDRRCGQLYGAVVAGRAADGRPYLDRLATLNQLLATRRAEDAMRAARRALVHRLFGWLLPRAAVTTPAGSD